LIGTVDESVAKGYGNMKGFLGQFMEIRTPEDIRMGRLRALESFRVPEQREMALLSWRIAPEIFRGMVSFLTPIVSKRSYLFSVNQDREGLYFLLDGQVLGIEKK